VPYPIDQLNSLDFRVKAGGTYTPPNCEPLQKIAIVIPFRSVRRSSANLFDYSLVHRLSWLHFLYAVFNVLSLMESPGYN